MSTFIMTAVAEANAEEIVEHMLEDGEFASEIWREIFSALHRGQLLDDVMDIIKGDFDNSEQSKALGCLRIMTDSVGDHLEQSD